MATVGGFEIASPTVDIVPDAVIENDTLPFFQYDESFKSLDPVPVELKLKTPPTEFLLRVSNQPEYPEPEKICLWDLFLDS